MQTRIVDNGPGLQVDGPFWVNGDVNLGNSNLSWDGEVLWGGSFNNVGSTVSGGMRMVPRFPDMTFDADTFVKTATLFLPDGTVLPPGTHTGRIYCDGSLTLADGCRIEGTVFCANMLELSGNIELEATDSSTVVVANGVRMLSGNSLTINGAVFVEWSFVLSGVTLVGTGAIVSDNDLSMNSCDVNWTFDNSVSSDSPPYVFGGPRHAEDLEVAWQRPYAP